MHSSSLPPDWRHLLAEEFEQPYFRKLADFLEQERKHHTIYPPEADMFHAFQSTPIDRVAVLLLGQDPYHGPGQAHGLAFSVKPGVKPPPSLANMYRELHHDLGCKVPNHGCLDTWAERGVLLLNTVLTVRAGEANSHKGQGWEQFTDAVIDHLNAQSRGMVFLLWGAHARKKAKRITGTQHRIVEGAHPSPLSASKFFGSKPYSAVNAALEEIGRPALDWCIPDR
ncbi:MAG: uracil-DNA glycosylase [Gemmataceae bacterium]